MDMSIDAYTKMLRVLNKRLEVRRELSRLLGREFVNACDEDAECSRTLTDIARVTVELEESMSEEEKRSAREKVLDILRKKLEELGIKFSCDELNLGELGTFYKDCYIEFMEEEFSISEVM